jgi:hypothetical protein
MSGVKFDQSRRDRRMLLLLSSISVSSEQISNPAMDVKSRGVIGLPDLIDVKSG